MDELEPPALRIPLNDQGLVLLGRVTVMWGHIDFYVGQAIENLYRISRDERRSLIGDRSIGPKVVILRHAASRAANAETKEKIIEACRKITAIIPRRNVVAHGVWGWWTGGEAKLTCASMLNIANPPFLADDLLELHNDVAVASASLDEALCAIQGRESKRDREFFFGDRRPFE